MRMKRVLMGGLAVALLALLATYVAYRADLSSLQQRLEAGSRVAATACGDVEYSIQGEGPAVLVVHGAGGGYDQVADLAELLADAGYQAIAMSRFGYLRTPLPPDGSPAAQADAHACLLDAIGVRRAAALGLSAGAPSAIEFCIRHEGRCSALMLLVPAIPVPGRGVDETTPPSPFWQFVFNHVLQSDFVIWAVTRLRHEVLIETVLATPLDVYRNAGPAEQARARAVVEGVFPVSLKRAGLENDARVTHSALAHALEQITAPTLVISTHDDLYDTAVGARYAAGRITDAQLIIFPSGGHAWLGYDQAVRDALLCFLDPRRRTRPRGCRQ